MLHRNHLYLYTVHDTSSVPSSTEIEQHYAEVDEGIVQGTLLIAVNLSLCAETLHLLCARCCSGRAK